MKSIDNCKDAADSILVGIFGLLAIGVAFAAVVGWVLNIVKLAPMDGATGMLVLRAVGILFPPLGAVMGYVS